MAPCTPTNPASTSAQVNHHLFHPTTLFTFGWIYLVMMTCFTFEMIIAYKLILMKMFSKWSFALKPSRMKTLLPRLMNVSYSRFLLSDNKQSLFQWLHFFLIYDHFKQPLFGNGMCMLFWTVRPHTVLKCRQIVNRPQFSTIEHYCCIGIWPLFSFPQTFWVSPKVTQVC